MVNIKTVGISCRVTNGRSNIVSRLLKEGGIIHGGVFALFSVQWKCKRAQDGVGWTVIDYSVYHAKDAFRVSLI